MPVTCWRTKDGWACRWGRRGKIYRSKSRARAKAKAERQGRAARASGAKG